MFSVGSLRVASSRSLRWVRLRGNVEMVLLRRGALRARYVAALQDALATREVGVLGTPLHNTPNHHLMALLMPNRRVRDGFIAFMASVGICCPFHYVPLHSSPFGRRHNSGVTDTLPGAERMADTIVRLPLYFNMTDAELERVIDAIQSWLRTC